MLQNGPAAAGNGGSSSRAVPFGRELPAAADSNSLDTWQQIDKLDVEPASAELEQLLESYEHARRPTTAEVFGTTRPPLEDELELARWSWYSLATTERPPAPEPIDPELLAPPTPELLEQLRADLELEPSLERFLTRAQRAALELDKTDKTAELEETSRLVRNDRAKVVLSDTIARAAAEQWAAGDVDGAIWLEKRGLAMGQCRSVKAYRDALCGSYLARPISCRVRVCPDCERARSARLAHRFADLTLDMARPIFWTFTVPNVAPDQLERGVDWLLESFRRLRRRGIFTGRKCLGDPSCTGHKPAAGGVYALEVTYNEKRADWHPHVHALLDAPFIRWAEMRAAWRAVTCDAIRYLEQGGGRVPRCAHRADELGAPLDGCRGARVVWVEAVRGAPGSDERLHAIREVLKYTVGGLVKDDGKLAGAAPDARLADLLLVLRNRRLVAGWGSWRNVTDDDPDDEDPDILRGDDVAPELRGLPAHCPECGKLAMWELPIELPRRSCTLAPDGSLRWRPPPAPRLLQ